MPITIVGLGPGDPQLLTRAAWDVLAGADEIVLRTGRHPTVAALPAGAAIRTFDDLYEQAEAFEAVYERIADEIVRLAERPQGVLYAVPGHPLVGEGSVTRILARARDAGQPVTLVAGLSFIEPVLSLLERDALDGLQIFDATDVARLHHPPLNSDAPALLAQLYSRELAGDVKLTLLNLLPPEHEVTVVQAAGAWGTLVERMPLHELDHEHPLWSSAPHLTSLFVPALPATSSCEGLAETVARLRAPGGCPWDREQTHQSLRSELLEEAYEVLAALDADDPDALREELGDLLLNVLMQVQIAVEGGEFSLAEVIAQIDAKLKRRHPHVFGDTVVANLEELLANWERIKHAERAAQPERGERSLLAGIPPALPALAQAQGYQKRAARVGFDWPDVDGVVAKVLEEVGELRAARGSRRREAELGDLLFAVVNWARWLKVDGETALRTANRRFAERFASIEAAARAAGRPLREFSLAELDALWEQAKAGERRRRPRPAARKQAAARKQPAKGKQPSARKRPASRKRPSARKAPRRASRRAAG